MEKISEIVGIFLFDLTASTDTSYQIATITTFNQIKSSRGVPRGLGSGK